MHIRHFISRFPKLGLKNLSCSQAGRREAPDPLEAAPEAWPPMWRRRQAELIDPDEGLHTWQVWSRRNHFGILDFGSLCVKVRLPTGKGLGIY